VEPASTSTRSTRGSSASRRIGPVVLRSLDAIHVATAVLIDADIVVTFDGRLGAACSDNGVVATIPRATTPYG
jgi:predicted nucleic acid-binding protein